MSATALIAIALFVVLLAFVFWLSRRQVAELDGWLDRKIGAEGWRAGADPGAIEQDGWSWLASLRASRDVTVDRWASNPGHGTTRAAFTLVTRRWGQRAGAKRHVGVGIVAALPRPIGPPLLAVPGPPGAGGRFLRWFLAIEPPAVSLSDERLAHRWSIYSPDPERADATLAADSRLRDGLLEVFAEAVMQGRFQVLVLELDGEAATLIGGPKMVGRQPFADLEEVAGLLAGRLGTTAQNSG